MEKDCGKTDGSYLFREAMFKDKAQAGGRKNTEGCLPVANVL